MSHGFVTTHINYGWQNFSEDYHVTCCKCSHQVRRTAKAGCNRLADRDYIKKLREDLEKSAKTYSQQTDFICNKCLTESSDMDLDFSEDVSQNIDVQSVLSCEEMIRDAAKKQQPHLRELEKQYKKRIVKYKNQLWIIYSLSSSNHFSYGSDIQIYCSLDKLHAKRPWDVTAISEHGVNLNDLEISNKFLTDIQPKV